MAQKEIDGTPTRWGQSVGTSASKEEPLASADRSALAIRLRKKGKYGSDQQKDMSVHGGENPLHGKRGQKIVKFRSGDSQVRDTRI